MNTFESQRVNRVPLVLGLGRRLLSLPGAGACAVANVVGLCGQGLPVLEELRQLIFHLQGPNDKNIRRVVKFVDKLTYKAAGNATDST